MDNVVLFTVKDLARRWQKDENSIRRYVTEGVLNTCKGVPGIMFHPKYIAELEGVELERFSPLEKRRMDGEIEELKMIISKQNDQLRKMAILGIESMSILRNLEE